MSAPDQPYIVTDTATGTWLPGLPTPRLIAEGRGHAWQQHEGIWRLAEPDDDEEAVYRLVTVVPTGWLCRGTGCTRTHRVTSGNVFVCPEHLPEVLGDDDPDQPYPFDGIPTSPKVPVDMSTQTSDDAPVNTTTPGASPEKETPMTTTTAKAPRARKAKADVQKVMDDMNAQAAARRAERKAKAAKPAPAPVAAPAPAPVLDGRTPALAPVMATNGWTMLGLLAKFKGQTLTATVDASGVVTMDGETYTSPSKAATVAVSKVNGKPASINGWTFWSAVNPDTGDTVALDSIRTSPPVPKGTRVGIVTESAPGAPALPAVRKPRVLGPAQQAVADAEKKGGAEFAAFVASDAGQAILEAAAKESLGAARAERDEALPF